MTDSRWRRLKQAAPSPQPEPELPAHRMVTAEEAKAGPPLVFTTCGLKLFDTKHVRIAPTDVEVTCTDCLHVAAENQRERARWKRLRASLTEGPNET